MLLNSSKDAPMRTATESTSDELDMPRNLLFQRPGDNALVVVADFDHVCGQNDDIIPARKYLIHALTHTHSNSHTYTVTPMDRNHESLQANLLSASLETAKYGKKIR